jgi:small-conductance mechanosensitive channel
MFTFFPMIPGIEPAYINAILAFCAGFLGLHLLKHVVLKRIHEWVAQTHSTWGSMLFRAVQGISWPLMIVLPLYFAVQFVEFPHVVERIISAGTLLVVIYYVTSIAQMILVWGIQSVIRRSDADEEGDETVLQIVQIAVRIILWSIAVILVLQNLGYQVTALLGGIGIAGIAIGFALQNVLGDIFSFFSIYFDKPFRVGDFIVVGTEAGTVERIGIKTTRIRTLQGQELVIANTALTSERVHNYKRMEDRRVVLKLGVEYQTPVKKLEQIPAMLKEVIEAQEQTRFDRAHLNNLGDSSLEYEVVYHVLTREYDVYMDVHQSILLELLRRLEKAKIVIAYPTQTVHLMK